MSANPEKKGIFEKLNRRLRGHTAAFALMTTATAGISADVKTSAIAAIQIDAKETKKMSLQEIIGQKNNHGQKESDQLNEDINKLVQRYEQMVKNEGFTDEILNNLIYDIKNPGDLAEVNYEEGQGSVLNFSLTGKYNCESFSLKLAMALESLIKKLTPDQQTHHSITFMRVVVDDIPHQKIVLQREKKQEKTIVYTHLDQNGVQKDYGALSSEMGVYISLADLKKSLVGNEITIISKAPKTKDYKGNRHFSPDQARINIQGGLPADTERSTPKSPDFTSPDELKSYLDSLTRPDPSNKGRFVVDPMDLKGVKNPLIIAREAGEFMANDEYSSERTVSLGDLNRWIEISTKAFFEEARSEGTNNIQRIEIEVSDNDIPDFFIKELEKSQKLIILSIKCKKQKLPPATLERLAQIKKISLELNYTNVSPAEIEILKKIENRSININGGNLSNESLADIPAYREDNIAYPTVTIPFERYLQFLRDPSSATILAQNEGIHPDLSNFGWPAHSPKVIEIAYYLSFYNKEHSLVKLIVQGALDNTNMLNHNPIEQYKKRGDEALGKSAEKLHLSVSELKQQIGIKE